MRTLEFGCIKVVILYQKGAQLQQKMQSKKKSRSTEYSLIFVRLQLILDEFHRSFYPPGESPAPDSKKIFNQKTLMENPS
ncbi:MAG: hypothetical protein KA251_06380 [Saprospiraceae bacterium]|nr:hypothetical protein [Candidatus Vicinibacter affinis]MBP6174039.1 hypothetical protein [Saprospiraceae bacterium]MBK6571357.1 hypothetical protein [Candidatus Vicinibacter affinis]MBK6823288.1 hypothetical protein [Candidatus Vicinibacter affinis]MBK7303600.1 hypothetical protein [Candidatus Vicinibacter affinis]